MYYLFLSLRTLRITFTELRSSFTSLASRYSAALAIHANALSISGHEVGISTITDVFLKRKVLRLLSIFTHKKNYSITTRLITKLQQQYFNTTN